MTYADKLRADATRHATSAYARAHTSRLMLRDLCARIDAHIAQGLAQAEPEPEAGHDDDTVPVSQAELARRLRLQARARAGQRGA